MSNTIFTTRQLPAPTGPADDWHLDDAGAGVEEPGELEPGGTHRTLTRTFAFLDLCGSTAYLQSAGAQAAVTEIANFRTLTRNVAAHRGVRVAKWLGDGAMLVGVAPGPVVATAVELCQRTRGNDLPARAGVSISDALLFDGDDYIGRGANFAARLCNDAEPGETLADLDLTEFIPTWVTNHGMRAVLVRGMGIHSVHILTHDS